MRVEPRTGWNGPAMAPGYATAGAKLLVVLHHSFAPHRDCGASKSRERADMLGMHRYHRDTQRWGGIGYNFCVFQSGNAYEGRGWGRTGAHTAGRNSSSVGICLVIDGSAHSPTDAAIEAVRQLISEGIRKAHIAVRHEVAPHDQFQLKVCPGAKVKASGLLGGVIPPVHDSGAIVPKPTLRKGKGGRSAPADIYEAVRELQRRLGMPDQLRTGFFGDLTEAAVREFQRRHALTVDGIMGPKSWSVLLN